MAGSRRTKSGCITCRIRRVKCDEAKPKCQRCSSTGRKCDGYTTLPYSRQDLIASAAQRRRADGVGLHYSKSAAPPSQFPSVRDKLPRFINDTTFDDVWQKRCFQFFRHKTVNSTNTLIDARFWDRVVLQAAQVEPAVKHGILALSTFDQLLTENDASLQNRVLADHQYQLALQYAQQLLAKAGERDIERVLITCIICIHYESIRGQFDASNQHMINGRAIIRQYSNKVRQASRRSDLAEIQQAFARLDAAFGSFTNRSAPYHATIENFHDTAPFLIPWAFNDVQEARNCLFDLSRWLLVSRHQMYRAWLGGALETFAKYDAEKNLSKIRLQEWYDHFEAVPEKTKHDPTTLTLRLWYETLLLLVEPGVIGLETRYDKYLDCFERTVSLGEEIVKRLSESAYNQFSYDVGYTTAMFFTAHRCRNPQLRRRAVNLLRAIPRQEGNFLSMPAADVIERLVQYEESGPVAAASDVPEERRVGFVAMEFDFETGKVEAEFFKMPLGEMVFRLNTKGSR